MSRWIDEWNCFYKSIFVFVWSVRKLLSRCLRLFLTVLLYLETPSHSLSWMWKGRNEDLDRRWQTETCLHVSMSCMHNSGIFSKVRHPPSQRNGILVGMSIPKVERPKSPSTWRLHARETCSVCKSYRNLSQPAHQFAGRLLFLRSVRTTLCVQGWTRSISEEINTTSLNPNPNPNPPLRPKTNRHHLPLKQPFASHQSHQNQVHADLSQIQETMARNRSDDRKRTKDKKKREGWNIERHREDHGQVPRSPER